MRFRSFVLVSLVALLLLSTGCGPRKIIVEVNDDEPTEAVVTPTMLPTPLPDSATLYMLTDTVKDIQMESFVIYTSGGALIVIDGGYSYNAPELLQLLKDITGSSKPEVDAWYLTHCHEDHVDAFTEIMTNHSDEIVVKCVYYNFLPGEIIQEYEETAYKTYEKITVVLNKLYAKQKHIVQQGEIITVKDVTMEVLVTPDLTLTSNVLNESSCAVRLTVAGKTLIFLGDLGEQNGYNLRKNYHTTGDLYCDYLQIAHHGSNGVKYTLYKYFMPKVCLWCTPEWLWINDNGKGAGTGPWETQIVYNYLKDELKCNTHYIAKDGNQSIVIGGAN